MRNIVLASLFVPFFSFGSFEVQLNDGDRTIPGRDFISVVNKCLAPTVVDSNGMRVGEIQFQNSALADHFVQRRNDLIVAHSLCVLLKFGSVEYYQQVEGSISKDSLDTLNCVKYMKTNHSQGIERILPIRSEKDVLDVINLIALSKTYYDEYMANANKVLAGLPNSNVKGIRGIQEHPHSQEFLAMLSSHTTMLK